MSKIHIEEQTFSNPEDFTNAEIICLSGILGNYDDLKDPNIELVIDIERKKDYIKVFISTIDIKELRVTIYPLNKLVFNNSFVKRGIKKGLAFQWVKSQVTFATLFPFKNIEGFAHREDSDTKVQWNGYFIWHKFGYLMDEDSVENFKYILLRDGRTENNINELMSSDEGISYWKNFGCKWYARFDLGTNSDSRSTLRDYKPSGKVYK